MDRFSKTMVNPVADLTKRLEGYGDDPEWSITESIVVQRDDKPLTVRLTVVLCAKEGDGE